MTHTRTRQITLRATDEQDAQLQELRGRWGLSQEATFWRAVREALESDAQIENAIDAIPIYRATTLKREPRKGRKP